jgi:hypothetical protein
VPSASGPTNTNAKLATANASPNLVPNSESNGLANGLANSHADRNTHAMANRDAKWFSHGVSNNGAHTYADSDTNLRADDDAHITTHSAADGRNIWTKRKTHPKADKGALDTTNDKPNPNSDRQSNASTHAGANWADKATNAGAFANTHSGANSGADAIPFASTDACAYGACHWHADTDAHPRAHTPANPAAHPVADDCTFSGTLSRAHWRSDRLSNGCSYTVSNYWPHFASNAFSDVVAHVAADFGAFGSSNKQPNASADKLSDTRPHPLTYPLPNNGAHGTSHVHTHSFFDSVAANTATLVAFSVQNVTTDAAANAHW